MSELSEEGLVAAIQVQLIYIIMRLVHGENQADGLDLQIVITFKVGYHLASLVWDLLN